MFHRPGAMLLMLFLILVLTVIALPCQAKSGRILDDCSKISWQPAFRENGATVIPGSLQTGFGRFEFRWVVVPKGTAKLVTLESPGAGELPLREKKLFLWVRKDHETILFQEWLPLANGKEPRTIRPIAKVRTNELFSVLPKKQLPPASALSQRQSYITWGNEYSKNSVWYLPGSLKASFGTLNIYWRKESARIPELITLESPGAGELPLREISLYLWNDEQTNTSTIFQERQPLLNQDSTTYLWPLVTVKTDELMAGFRQLD
jgi:hypothetical protein